MTAFSRTFQQFNVIGKGSWVVTSECCLLPGGDSCPFCLQVLLPGLLLVLIVIISILAFRILPKYKASKFFSFVCYGSWVQKAKEKVKKKKGKGNTKWDMREREKEKMQKAKVNEANFLHGLHLGLFSFL